MRRLPSASTNESQCFGAMSLITIHGDCHSCECLTCQMMRTCFRQAIQATLLSTGLPLYEAKLIHHFDHRLASYDKRAPGSQDSNPSSHCRREKRSWRSPVPRYWVEAAEVHSRLARRGWNKDWLLGWRDICRSSDERTVIAAIIPRSAVGNKFPLLLTDSRSAKWFFLSLHYRPLRLITALDRK